MDGRTSTRFSEALMRGWKQGSQWMRKSKVEKEWAEIQSTKPHEITQNGWSYFVSVRDVNSWIGFWFQDLANDSVHTFTQSLQIATPGAVMTFVASVIRLEQNEQRISVEPIPRRVIVNLPPSITSSCKASSM
jgi:hypothetical protein